ncbi:hypothetical protein [Caniella muris]|uniref:hypothetical protein n=1 Tax=Caniella muris TaxID=2941502 RepID=UPI00203A62B2|nr:hypothetical protein [Caniella muris]
MSDASFAGSPDDYTCDICALTGLAKETVDEAVECFRDEDKDWWSNNVVEADGTWWCTEQHREKIEYFLAYPFVLSSWTEHHGMVYSTVNSFLKYHHLYETNSRKQRQLYGGSRKQYVCIDTKLADALIERYSHGGEVVDGEIERGSGNRAPRGVDEVGPAPAATEPFGYPSAAPGTSGLPYGGPVSDEVRAQLEIRIQEKDDRIDGLEEEVRALRDEIERRVQQERDRGEAALQEAQRRYEELSERYEKLYADCVRLSYAAGCSRQVLKRVESAPFGVRISRKKYTRLIEGAVKEVGDTQAPDKPSSDGAGSQTYDEPVYDPGD